MARKLKIAFACNSSFGLYNFRGPIMRMLVLNSHEVFVIAPPDAYAPRLEELGCKFIPWNIAGQNTGLLQEVRTVQDLARILVNLAPDICFNFTIKPVIYGALFARFRQLNVVSVVTGLGYIFLNKGLLSLVGRTLYKLALGASKEIWFLNEEDRRLFSESSLLPNVRTKILPGEGIDSEYFSPMQGVGHEDGPFRFLMISRLLLDKGVREYVAAAKSLRAQGACAEFELIGAMDQHNPNCFPENELKEAILSGAIKYRVPVSDIRPVIASSSCVVLPSYREGVPRALLEAASMEKPIIATDVPGCRDVVTDKINGLLCEPRSTEQLAVSMKQMLAMTHHERLQMGVQGRARIKERFGQQLVSAEYVETIDRLCVAP